MHTHTHTHTPVLPGTFKTYLNYTLISILFPGNVWKLLEHCFYRTRGLLGTKLTVSKHLRPTVPSITN